MASIEDQVTAIYCFVDDTLKAHLAAAQWRTSPNNAPTFTDAEALTVALVQECLGVDTLKAAYEYVAANLSKAFPHLPTYKQWLARLHALPVLVGLLIQQAVLQHEMKQRLYRMDSKPIPLCKPVRHGRVRLLSEDGAHFGKNSVGWFYGFKLHLLTHFDGTILSAILTPANVNDRDPAVALAWSVQGGTVLADLGYPGKEIEELLWEEAEMLLVTPKHAGKKGEKKRALVSALREPIETVFSGLWRLFVDRVFSRSWNGLWNTIKLKLLFFNLRQVGLIPT